ncbi:MAG: cytochrome c biogenesis protein ResB [Geobacter sp.]|nr:cytochrome c biogenesis protein ResB [Nitrospirota bacterium]MBI5657720.1 cytochrome c biogenesis protein ResB [Geobacter sp.]
MNNGKRISTVIWDFVTSRNVAIVLLAVVTIMLAVGAVLPNPELLSPADREAMRVAKPFLFMLGERYNSQKMATGYVFGLTGIFLIISTSLCSIDRLVTRYRARGKKRFALPRDASPEGLITFVAASPDAGSVKLNIMNWLRLRRWRVAELPEASRAGLVGLRGEAGFWGSIFFHFVLITALFGLVVFYFGAYRGTLTFTEGQSYKLAEENFASLARKPVWGLNLPDVTLGLIRQYSIYPPGDPWNAVDHVAKFRVTQGGAGETSEIDVKINEPLMIDGKKILLQTGGFAPRFVISAGADVLRDSFVNLQNMPDDRMDGFKVGGTALTVEAKVYPDYYEKESGRPATRGREVVNPFVAMRVSDAGRVIFEGVIPVGGSAIIGGYSVVVPEMRRWVLMEMVGEPGIGFFFVVSFIGLIGVLVRVIDPEERLYVFIDEAEGVARVEIVPYSRHFSGLINERAKELAEHVKA